MTPTAPAPARRPRRCARTGTGERTATETMRQELEQSASLATLAPIWADVTRTHATRQYEATLQSLLPPI